MTFKLFWSILFAILLMKNDKKKKYLKDTITLIYKDKNPIRVINNPFWYPLNPPKKIKATTIMSSKFKFKSI